MFSMVHTWHTEPHNFNFIFSVKKSFVSHRMNKFISPWLHIFIQRSCKDDSDCIVTYSAWFKPTAMLKVKINPLLNA